MTEDEALDQLRLAQDMLEQVRRETNYPAVGIALRHAIYYSHLARGFLGDDGLSPELDAAFLEQGATR